MIMRIAAPVMTLFPLEKEQTLYLAMKVMILSMVVLAMIF